MQKTLSLLLFNASFLLAGIVLNRPLVAIANYPVVPSSGANIPFCYMDMADGRRLDLGELCGPMPEDFSGTCTSTAASLPVSNVKYEGSSLTGQVTNQSCKPVTLVKVNYQILDQQGNPIDNGFIYAQPATLIPGKTASFQGPIVPGSKVNITHVEWSDA